ncbi:MAG TPA: sterol desaturase family protein [Haliangium sp.]|nr:sterol desaturase family protein [Haliangium sp.]
MFVSQFLSLEGAQLPGLLAFAGVLFAFLLVRYVAIVGPLYLVCWKLLRGRLKGRRIQRTSPPRARVLKEFAWSLATFVVFSLVGVATLLMSRAGWTQRYHSIDERGWLYWAASVALMLVVHDAYFYWTHRFMHLRGVFRYFHRVHHLSFNPSPWAAFSFHPLEAVVEAGIVFVIALIMPFHPSALFAFLIIMTIMNGLGHLGYELYPRGFARGRLGRWVTTSVHHNMHHHYVHGNYGLYFTWWDRLMGTMHRQYDETFDAVTSRGSAARGGGDRSGPDGRDGRDGHDGRDGRDDQGAGRAVSRAASAELAAQRNPK